MSDFEIVERPSPVRRGPMRHPIVQAVIDSATTGHAVRFALNGSTPRQWEARIRTTAARAGLRSHIRSDGDHLVAWTEKRDG